MQPVVTSKILIYFSFFFPRFWVIYYFFVSFKLCCRCFINWFTFTFRRRLPADASAARPSLDFVRNFSKNFVFFFYFHWRRPRVHSSRHQHQRRLWVSFDDQIFWRFHYVCVSVWTDMYVVCACRYLWKRDAFDFWFRFGLTFLCVCVLSWVFFLVCYQFTWHIDSYVYGHMCMIICVCRKLVYYLITHIIIVFLILYVRVFFSILNNPTVLFGFKR